MQLSGSLVLFTQLLVLATTQHQFQNYPKDGLNLFLESAMKEFPQWLKSKLGDPLVQPETVEIYENDGLIELDGEIRDLELNGYTEQYSTVQADFFLRTARINVNFFPNLEIVGNYSLRGQVSNNSVWGEGVFKLSNFRYFDHSSVLVNLYNFEIAPDGRGRIDPTTVRLHSFVNIFDNSLPEFQGLQSAGYSKHIGRLIKSSVVEPFEQLLVNQLERYVRTWLEKVSLFKIVHDNYDGNLNNSFIDNDINVYTTEISDDITTTAAGPG